MNDPGRCSAIALMICLATTLNVASSDLPPDDEEIAIPVMRAPPLERTSGGEAEAHSGADATPVRSAAEFLAGLDETSRNNSLIDLTSVGPTFGPRSVPETAEIEALWNDGRHRQALRALVQLETTGRRFAPSVTWREPIVSDQKNQYMDVRIGSPREYGVKAVLDFHRGTGNLFVVVRWSDGWTMNISTDGGATWQETFAHSATLPHVGMAVVGDFAWVAYGSGTTVQMRRFFVTTGTADSSYSGVVDDLSPDNASGVVVTSNADDANSAIYVGVIADRAVRMYWDDLTGTSFTGFHPPVTDAGWGLDLTVNTHALGISPYAMFFSYVSFPTPDSWVKVWRLPLFGPWEEALSIDLPQNTNPFFTAISAFDDTVMVAHMDSSTAGVTYRISNDAGGSWDLGAIYAPQAGDPTAGIGPDISLRSGSGIAATYLLDEGPFDGAYTRTHRGFSPGPWAAPVLFNDFDAATSSKTTIEWLGALCVNTHGMIYMAGDVNIPYFDLIGERAFFCDGFESGNTNAWN